MECLIKFHWKGISRFNQVHATGLGKKRNQWHKIGYLASQNFYKG